MSDETSMTLCIIAVILGAVACVARIYEADVSMARAGMVQTTLPSSTTTVWTRPTTQPAEAKP